MSEQSNQQNQTSNETEAPKTYGQMLREAREARGLAPEQVASQLRVSVRQIEALENCELGMFPSAVYARAHLRSYAKLLHMNGEVIDVFNNSLPRDDKDDRNYIRQTTKNLAPYHDAQPGAGKSKAIAWVCFLAVLAVVGYLAYGYVKDNGQFKSLAPSVEQKAPETAPVAPEAAPKEVAKPQAEQPKPKVLEDKPKAETPKAKPEDDNRVKPQTIQEIRAQIAAEAAEKERIAREQAAAAAAAEAAAKAEAERIAREAAEAAARAPLQLAADAEGALETSVTDAKDGEVTVTFETTGQECWYGIYKDDRMIHNTQLKTGASKQYQVTLPVNIRVGNRLAGTVKIDSHPVVMPELADASRSVSLRFTVKAQ